MISVNNIFGAVSQQTNTDENGQLLTSFNYFLKMTEIALMDWLTGKLDESNLQTPSPSKFLTQKNKDWLAPFIVSSDKNFKEGKLEIPADYYTKESFRVAWFKSDCDESGTPVSWHDVTVLNSSKIANRLQSSIPGIKPTSEMPVAEMISEKDGKGNKSYFLFHPGGMDGQSKLIYIRYPRYAAYETKLDQTYNEEVYDSTKSTDLEWPESLYNYFVNQITYYVSKRHGAVEQFQMNQSDKKP